MLRGNKLKDYMSEELPSLTYQKRLMYRTDIAEVQQIYRLLNSTIFDNQLAMPQIQVFPRLRYWGICFGHYERPRYSRSHCIIRLIDKWYCKQWLITIVAHEMCHQYQWDVLGAERKMLGKDPIMSHGPSFYLYRDELKKHGIALKESFSRAKWFRYQNLFKC